MSYTEKRDILETGRTQNADVISVIAQLQTLDSTLTSVVGAIQAIIDAGQFDTIDAEIKTPIVTAFNQAKSLKTAFENVDTREVLDWRP